MKGGQAQAAASIRVTRAVTSSITCDNSAPLGPRAEAQRHAVRQDRTRQRGHVVDGGREAPVEQGARAKPSA